LRHLIHRDVRLKTCRNSSNGRISWKKWICRRRTLWTSSKGLWPRRFLGKSLPFSETAAWVL
jgi:hypothetical protein